MKFLLTISLFLLCATTKAQTSGIGYPRFEYNYSAQVKTVTLDGTYMDFKGALYVNRVTINPYKSWVGVKLLSPPLALLIKDFSLSTGASETTIRIVIVDDQTGLEKTITTKYRFK